MPLQENPDDSVLDSRISILLSSGMAISAIVILIGGVFFLLHMGTSVADYRIFHGLPADLTTLSGIFRGAFQLRALGIIQLGLLLLIATPVARVLFSVIAFWMERDYLYVVVSGIVLAVLLYSLFVHSV